MLDSNQKAVSQWLESIGLQRGLKLNLDENGGAYLDCKDGLQVLIEVPKDGDICCLYAPLLRMPDDLEAQSTVLKKALALGNFSLETGGASFGFDARTAHLLLTFAERVELLDADLFAECLGRFIALSTDMKERLSMASPTPFGPQACADMLRNMIRG